jgi:predicted RNA binding protein YcfA (HicA-like mRNA interferase family)
MTFWERVALHEARGLPRPVALRVAYLVEARPPTTRWNELVHPRNRLGEFIPTDDKGHPIEPKSMVGSRVPSLTPRQVYKMLRKAGFRQTGQKGSHAMFEPPGGGRKVVVPMHARSIPRGTLMNILTVASLSAVPA